MELLPGLHWLLVCVGIVVPAFEGKACQQVLGLLWQVFPIVLLAQWLCVGASENVGRKDFACREHTFDCHQHLLDMCDERGDSDKVN